MACRLTFWTSKETNGWQVVSTLPFSIFAQVLLREKVCLQTGHSNNSERWSLLAVSKWKKVATVRFPTTAINMDCLWYCWYSILVNLVRKLFSLEFWNWMTMRRGCPAEWNSTKKDYWRHSQVKLLCTWVLARRCCFFDANDFASLVAKKVRAVLVLSNFLNDNDHISIVNDGHCFLVRSA